LSEHQEPEILRTPLETPILKLKLYDEQQEPEVILSQTLNPPSLDVIINTIFRLEKMGALTNVFYHQKNANNDIKYKEIIESNGVTKRKKIENNSKIKYSSGNITYIGKIFADLPIDIKFSRLIVLSFALGQIDVGITLAAILSQERQLFLNSNKCNRISLYDSKRYYCDNQNCDFIASYTAYKLWCSKYRGEFINENMVFDTRLKKVNYNKYKEIQEVYGTEVAELVKTMRKFKHEKPESLSLTESLLLAADIVRGLDNDFENSDIADLYRKAILKTYLEQISFIISDREKLTYAEEGEFASRNALWFSQLQILQMRLDYLLDN
jgi:ATP-dependent RNA helicase TDRD9